MAPETSVLAILNAALAAHGLVVRGGIAIRDDDALPALPSGVPARSMFLIGNVGGAMWPAFAASRDRLVPPGSTDPLDDWTRAVIAPLADQLGATALYPFDGPPFYPFQRWAERAEPVAPSPLMIYIHPKHGLWHAYRAALLLPDEASSAREPAPPPCDSCAGRPCLSACPVNAFTGTGFDDMACARHVDSDAGTECRERGCLARRACPVGAGLAYPPAQMAFHMEAFLARRRNQP
jgi:hypothetical protein